MQHYTSVQELGTRTVCWVIVDRNARPRGRITQKQPSDGKGNGAGLQAGAMGLDSVLGVIFHSSQMFKSRRKQWFIYAFKQCRNT